MKNLLLLTLTVSLTGGLIGCSDAPVADTSSDSGEAADHSETGDRHAADSEPAPTVVSDPPAVLESAGQDESDAANSRSTESSAADTVAADGGPAGGPDMQPDLSEGSAEDAEDIPALEPGGAAPPIRLAEVVHGPAFEGRQDGQIYVLEFWATWCGPCLGSMPHLAELQTHYGDSVRFIGVTSETPETVREFLSGQQSDDQTWADVVTYTLACDDNDRTSASYMEAAGQNGIPTAFIINAEGTVVWIGHPMGMDDPLQQVVDGTYDVESARSEFLLSRHLNEALQTGSYDRALTILEEHLSNHPDDVQHALLRLQLLMVLGRTDELSGPAVRLAESHPDDLQVQAVVARILADNAAGDAALLDTALACALKAVELVGEPHPDALALAAHVYSARGEPEQAVAWQKKAIAAADDTEPYEHTLKQYEIELNRTEGEENEEGEKESTDTSSDSVDAPEEESAADDSASSDSDEE